MTTLVPRRPNVDYAPSMRLDELDLAFKDHHRWCAIVHTAPLDAPPPSPWSLPVGVGRTERVLEAGTPRQRYRAWVALVYGSPQMLRAGSVMRPTIVTPEGLNVYVPRGTWVLAWGNPTFYHTFGITEVAWAFAGIRPPLPAVAAIPGRILTLGPGVYAPTEVRFTAWLGSDLAIALAQGRRPLRGLRPRVVLVPRTTTRLNAALAAANPASMVLDAQFGCYQVDCCVRAERGQAQLVLGKGEPVPLGAGFSLIISGPTDLPALAGAAAYRQWFLSYK